MSECLKVCSVFCFVQSSFAFSVSIFGIFVVYVGQGFTDKIENCDYKQYLCMQFCKNCIAIFCYIRDRNSSLGVVKFFKVPFLQQFSTDLTPKVNDQPRIFPATSIWSRTVVSNLKNASNLWCSKFNPKRNSFQRCIIWV